jgi:DNA-binding transcriptional LysR family regulator
MKFRHLEYFVAAAEELNFTHAADRLNVSEPPFSKQIQHLGRYTGTERSAGVGIVARPALD